MKIVVDRGRCTGLGICESIAPDYFEVDDDGHLSVLVDKPSAEDKDRVEEAVRGCPTHALTLIED